MGVQPAPAHITIGFQIGLGAAAELDALGVFGALQLPEVAAAQPVIRLLNLIAVLDALAEHAIGIADAIASHGQAQSGATVHEAGCQPPEATVAEAGIVLALAQFFQGQAQLIQRLADRFGDAQVEHGVAQRPAHQEFHRQVIGAAHTTVFLAGIAGVLPALPQPVAQGQDQRFVQVVGMAGVAITPQGMAEVVTKIGGNALGIHAQGR